MYERILVALDDSEQSGKALDHAAAKMAGLEKVPAIILDAPLGAEDSLAMRLVENIHREGLDPIDEA